MTTFWKNFVGNALVWAGMGMLVQRHIGPEHSLASTLVQVACSLLGFAFLLGNPVFKGLPKDK